MLGATIPKYIRWDAMANHMYIVQKTKLCIQGTHRRQSSIALAASWYGYHFRSFSWYGVGSLVRIPGIMDRFINLDILKNYMGPYAFENLPITYQFMHDNDRKDIAKVVKQLLQDEKINIF